MVDLQYIKEAIKNWGQCKTMAVTQWGAVAIGGRNAWATCGRVPDDLVQHLKSINGNGYSIDEVTLREDGSWAIVFDDNTKFTGILPQEVGATCSEALRNGARVLSLDWIPVRKGAPLCCIGVTNRSTVRRRRGVLCGEGPSFFSLTPYFEGDFYYGENYSIFRRLEENGSSNLFGYSFLMEVEGLTALTVTLCTLDGNRTEHYWAAVPNLKPMYREKIIDKKAIDGSDPFYAVVNGIVSNPYRLKLFPGYRYFLSNQDGSQFYYCL